MSTIPGVVKDPARYSFFVSTALRCPSTCLAARTRETERDARLTTSELTSSPSRLHHIESCFSEMRPQSSRSERWADPKH
ncbi:hypothetical protein [Cohaesibacter marisflavi]|uniref:hypothetical protein n=1 Tax=Cohaesibacter marisflavi TaxID=655353 RepID=UPI0029C908E8|nr:hypothetical protein [Cohaesibacter marisflavi]